MDRLRKKGSIIMFLWPAALRQMQKMGKTFFGRCGFCIGAVVHGGFYEQEYKKTAQIEISFDLHCHYPIILVADYTEI